jgi:hypothetical protein
MIDDVFSDKREADTGAGGMSCPWCRGRLVLQPTFPLRKLIPGDPRGREDSSIPEALRTIRAWVCATPHCRYREIAS